MILKYIFIFLVVLAIHTALLKWLPYRWLYNSIIFPFTLLYVTFKYDQMTALERRFAIQNFQTRDHWSKPYWFSDYLERYLILRYLQ